jgi:hypothetical protein
LIKIADSTWGDVQTVADDEIAAVVDEAHRHNVKVTIHSGVRLRPAPLLRPPSI